MNIYTYFRHRLRNSEGAGQAGRDGRDGQSENRVGVDSPHGDSAGARTRRRACYVTGEPPPSDPRHAARFLAALLRSRVHYGLLPEFQSARHSDQ